MKIPSRLQPLIDDGIIDRVLQQLKSGKEADLFLVLSRGETCCAKIYKDSLTRSFKNQSQYEEGRKVRNSRRSRALAGKSRYGQQESERLWQSAEVDALYKLVDAGVRVPKPLIFYEGVLLMECITDSSGAVAPRISDCSFSEKEAVEHHRFLIGEVVKMLCVGLVHADLSEFNILMGKDGPTIIDLPQSVNSSGNNSAKQFFMRDVDNLARFFGLFAPQLKKTHFGKEIWHKYISGELTVDTPLTGEFKEKGGDPSLSQTLWAVRDAEREEMARRERETQEYEDDPIGRGRKARDPHWKQARKSRYGKR